MGAQIELIFIKKLEERGRVSLTHEANDKMRPPRRPIDDLDCLAAFCPAVED